MPFPNGRYYASRFVGRATELAGILAGRDISPVRGGLDSGLASPGIHGEIPSTGVYSRQEAS